MIEVKEMRVMEILANATNVIAEGEVLQLINCHHPETTEDDYLQVIRSKTAKLFEAATQLGAVISQQSAPVEQAMALYGMHLGTAFQLIDDVLDYNANAEDMGKQVGDDLAEGKPTLPLIYALKQGNPEQQQILRQAIIQGGKEHIDAVVAAIESTQAIAYTIEMAQEEAEKATAALALVPASPYADALYALAHFSIHRHY